MDDLHITVHKQVTNICNERTLTFRKARSRGAGRRDDWTSPSVSFVPHPTAQYLFDETLLGKYLSVTIVHTFQSTAVKKVQRAFYCHINTVFAKNRIFFWNTISREIIYRKVTNQLTRVECYICWSHSNTLEIITKLQKLTVIKVNKILFSEVLILNTLIISTKFCRQSESRLTSTHSVHVEKYFFKQIFTNTYIW